MENKCTYTLRTSSVQETKGLAETLVPFLCGGDVILLEGDLAPARRSSSKRSPLALA